MPNFKASVEVSIQPFRVPNFALIDGQADQRSDEARAVSLSEIDPITLDALCRQFYKDVFQKAGKEPPPSASPTKGDTQ